MWAIIKYLGRNGIDQMISIMTERARQFAEEIGQIEGFSVENEVVFNQVLIRCHDDELTNLVLKKVQDLRECWAGGSTWFDKKVIRVSVCSWATTREDITRSVQSFKQARLEVSRDI
jgi:threonine aldolase